MTVYYHIRDKLSNRRGNQFYRDMTVREVKTLCGAPETIFDIAYRDKPGLWQTRDNQQVACCPKCLEEKKRK